LLVVIIIIVKAEVKNEASEHNDIDRWLQIRVNVFCTIYIHVRVYETY